MTSRGLFDSVAVARSTQDHMGTGFGTWIKRSPLVWRGIGAAARKSGADGPRVRGSCGSDANEGRWWRLFTVRLKATRSFRSGPRVATRRAC